ncbi:MAG: M20/M25/M40 family metallo-hydrolase, partial [Planctomycetota bacterium]|nr:M20/M25/M40 family metallo-hydrolase [Planctomycetota bacterium]
TGDFAKAEIVFAGYGIVAPQEGTVAEYDSFVHLEVKDRWVLALRDMPQDVEDAQRQHLSRFSTLRYKAMLLRDRGARGLLLTNGPRSNFRQPLIPLQFDGSQSSTSLPVLTLHTQVATEWLASAGKDLAKLQTELDQGSPQVGFAIPGPPLQATVDIQQEKRTGRNVLARLPADEPTDQSMIVGAHIDHLGTGANASSLARDDEQHGIHVGADDNASGVAGMLEIAESLSRRDIQKKDAKPRKRDIVFAAWSGEELGLLGSNHFVKSWMQGAETMYPTISACLNLDMIGRFEEKLVLQGINSSSGWTQLIEQCNVPVGLPVTLQDDSYLPTDASSFYVRSVPILSAFTGSHSDYHTPRDTPDKLEYESAARIAELMGRIALEVACQDAPPAFVVPQKGAPDQRSGRLRAYLGTIPDYAETGTPGVKLSGVAKGGPAEKAGVRAGDVIVELAGKKIENIYDYTYAIEALRLGRGTKIQVRRGDATLELEIMPQSRE